MIKTKQNTRTAPRTNGWTPERRAAQSAAIRRWAPWRQSTGPKTTSGKARAAANATKHGMRGAQWREFCLLLRLQQVYLRACREGDIIARRLGRPDRMAEIAMRLYKGYQNKNHTNELMDLPSPPAGIRKTPQNSCLAHLSLAKNCGMIPRPIRRNDPIPSLSGRHPAWARPLRGYKGPLP